MAAEGWKFGGGLIKGRGLPAPSGQYRVGCVDLMHQLEGDEKGGLLVRLHYPTEATPGAGYAYCPWIPNRAYIKGSLLLKKHTKFIGLKSLLVDTLHYPKVPALEGAPLFGSDSEDESSSAMPTFPVIVYSHGLGAMRTTYSSIACDLASHGYVVACVEHRDESAAASLRRVLKPGGMAVELEDEYLMYVRRDTVDFKVDPVTNAKQEFPYRNEQVKQRAAEVGKSLDLLAQLNEGVEMRNMLAGGDYDFGQFKGRMDVTMAVVMGQSFGGGTTVQTLATDTRFKCGIALDSWMIPIAENIYSSNSNISQPLYFINSSDFQWKENVKRMLPLRDDSITSPCKILTIMGTHHLNQSDVVFTSNSTLARLFDTEGESQLEPYVAHQVNMEICHAFLKRHLLKDPDYQGNVPILDGTKGHSKHVLFGTNLDVSEYDTPPPVAAASQGEGQGGGAQEEKEVEGKGSSQNGEERAAEELQVEEQGEGGTAKPQDEEQGGSNREGQNGMPVEEGGALKASPEEPGGEEQC